MSFEDRGPSPNPGDEPPRWAWSGPRIWIESASREPAVVHAMLRVDLPDGILRAEITIESTEDTAPKGRHELRSWISDRLREAFR